MRTLLTAATLLTFTVSGFAQTRPDFSGRWTLIPDSAQAGSGGLRPSPQVLVIRQDDKTVTIEEHRDDQPPVIVELTFDGKKSKKDVPLGRGLVVEAEYKTKWDKATLVTDIQRRIELSVRSVIVDIREKRSLQPDGTLVVDTTVRGRTAGRKALYRKDR